MIEDKPKYTHSRDMMLLKSIRDKVTESNVVICKSDKGHTVTLLDRTEYDSKMDSYVKDNNLVQTKDSFILNKNVAKVKKCISECPLLLKNTPNVSNPQIPKLYGLPKLHKEGNPMRPVVSCVSAPSSEVCKKLISTLPDLIKFKPKYAVKTNICLIDHLRKCRKIPKNGKLISFDVKNLFPSIPTDELKSIIINKTDHLNKETRDEIGRILESCLNQNFCTFNDVVYEIKKGLPIGSPISPLMAEIFMDHIENIVFQSKDPLISSILYWYRYVDDVFAIVNCSIRQLDKLLEKLNSVHESIQFTMELEVNNILNFLGLSIERVDGHLEFGIFRKDTFTDTVIDRRSNHPDHIKYSAFYSMIHRLISVPMTEDKYFLELSVIHRIAKNNGYEKEEINRILQKKLRKQKRETLYPKSDTQNENIFWRKIKYVNRNSLSLGNKLIKKAIKPAYYNKRTTGNFLINNKPRTSMEEKSGVYQIKCSDCDSIYKGLTSRSLHKRFSEHVVRPESNVAQHMAETGHSFDISNATILHSESRKS